MAQLPRSQDKRPALDVRCIPGDSEAELDVLQTKTKALSHQHQSSQEPEHDGRQPIQHGLERINGDTKSLFWTQAGTDPLVRTRFMILGPRWRLVYGAAASP